MRDWESYVRRHLSLADLAPEREARIVSELAQQLEDFYRDGLARGLREEEADAHARSQIPDWPGLSDEVRKVDRVNIRPAVVLWAERVEDAHRRKSKGWSWIADLVQDARYALRRFGRQPVFTLVAVLTLALGIGANTAIFSAVHAVLLRPFPYPDPERLAVISIFWPEGRFWLSEKDVLTLREQSTLFEGFAVLDEGSATLLGGGAPERLNVGLASANLFSLLQASTELGRVFSGEEELPNGPAVAVLSHELWQRRYGGDPDIIGRVLEFDGSRPAHIIGVMPRDFRALLPRHTNFHHRVDIWYPLQVDYRTIDRGRNLTVLARRKPEVTWPQAQEELDRIARNYFDAGSSNTFRAFPLHEDTVREIQPALLTLLAATGLVLLIVCANVANLLLAQGAARTKEMAIRTALGATRTRIIRQSLAESTILAVTGGAGGILLAWAGGRVLSSFLPPELPRLETIQLNATVFGVSLAVSLLTGFLFGIAPALRSAVGELGRALSEGTRGHSAGAVTGRMRTALIVGEIALSLMLLAGSILIIRSFLNLQKADLGYNPSNTLTFTITLPRGRYPSAETRNEFFNSLQDRIAGLSGVESVGANMLLPFGRSLFKTSFTLYGDQGSVLSRSALMRPALAGYFESMGSRLLAGRSFTREDGPGSERVAIVDETLARSAWPQESAIGKKLARGVNPENPSYHTIVGVVENLRLTDLTGEREGQVYVSASQYANTFSLSFVVRGRREPLSLLDPIRDILREMDPHVPMYDIGQLEETVAQERAPQRFTSLLMALFAVLGLTLAVVGVYGVISYTVNHQRHEIGVRVALGAREGDIYRMILGRGLRMAALGVALGLAGAMMLGNMIESLLWQVRVDDPWNYVLVSTILLLAALAACYIPARQATRIDPSVALRYE